MILLFRIIHKLFSLCRDFNEQKKWFLFFSFGILLCACMHSIFDEKKLYFFLLLLIRLTSCCCCCQCIISLAWIFFFSLFLSNLEKKILREKKMREKRKIDWRGNSFIIIYFLSLMMIWFDFFLFYFGYRQLVTFLCVIFFHFCFVFVIFLALKKNQQNALFK